MNKELTNNLAQIINYGVYNNVDLDTILNNIFNSLTSFEGISSNLKIEDVCDELETRKGSANKNNDVTLYRKGINDSIEEELSNAQFLSEQEVNMFKVTYYVKTLIHELQHVKLSQAKENGIDTIETSILKLIDTNPKSVNSLAYQLCYDSNPEERMVELYAFKSITDVLEPFKEEYQNLFKLINKEYLLEKFYNYYEYGLNGPTTQYLSFFIDNKKLKEFNKTLKEKNLSAEERVYYGLKISKSEYTSLVEEYSLLDDELKSLSENANKKNQ